MRLIRDLIKNKRPDVVLAHKDRLQLPGNEDGGRSAGNLGSSRLPCRLPQAKRPLHASRLRTGRAVPWSTTRPVHPLWPGAIRPGQVGGDRHNPPADPPPPESKDRPRRGHLQFSVRGITNGVRPADSGHTDLSGRWPSGCGTEPASARLLPCWRLPSVRRITTTAQGHRRPSRRYRNLHSAGPLVVIGTAPGRDLRFDEGITVALDVDHDQVMGAWAHCTMGVVPSVWEEPWGQVAAEAGTLGKPVVASRVGGLKDVVIDGYTGLLVPPSDPDALRTAIDLLMASPDMRADMGRRVGRARTSVHCLGRHRSDRAGHRRCHHPKGVKCVVQLARRRSGDGNRHRLPSRTS